MAEGGKVTEVVKVIRGIRKRARFVVLPEAAFYFYGYRSTHSSSYFLLLKRRHYLNNFEEKEKVGDFYQVFNGDAGKFFLVPPESFRILPPEMIFRLSLKTGKGITVPIPELLILLSYGRDHPSLLHWAFQNFEFSFNLLYKIAEEIGWEKMAREIFNYSEMMRNGWKF